LTQHPFTGLEQWWSPEPWARIWLCAEDLHTGTQCSTCLLTAGNEMVLLTPWTPRGVFLTTFSRKVPDRRTSCVLVAPEKRKSCFDARIFRGVSPWSLAPLSPGSQQA
ncbi:mCG144925, partial [Mus musculus]